MIDPRETPIGTRTLAMPEMLAQWSTGTGKPYKGDLIDLSAVDGGRAA